MNNMKLRTVLTNGAGLGLLLAVSFMLEARMMIAGSFAWYALEWIVVVVLHYYLLHRMTRSYSRTFDRETGFSFGQGYGFVLSLSAVAGVVVALVQYLYLHLFLGYANYTSRVADALSEQLAQNRGVTSSMQSLLGQSLEQLRNLPEPSAFQTLWGGVFSSVLFGAVFGLIIAGVLARQPKPFENTEDEQ